MSMLSTLLIFAACVSAMLAATALLQPTTVQRRLVSLGAPPLGAGGRFEAFSQRFGVWLRAIVTRWFSPTAERARNQRSQAVERRRMRLVRAGFRSEVAPAAYLAARAALVLGLPVAVTALRFEAPLFHGTGLLVALGAAGLGYVLPSLWLDRRTKKRQAAIELALPAALDLLVVCVEAGLGLMQSLGRIGKELRASAPELAEEFELVTLESRAGKGNAESLRALGQRTNVPEVRVLVAMLTQTERFGTSLAGALRVHCDTARTKRMQRAEERAAKAPLKMLFPTALILFALFGLIVGLAAIRATAVFGG